MLSSILPETFLNVSEEAPAPSRDFCQLQVTKKEVIYRWWHITPRNMGRHSKPGESRSSHDDFLVDSKVQSEVWRVFGKDTLDYVKRICSGELNYIQYMPKPILVQLLSYLDLEDVNRFACTCRQFRTLSESEDLWEVLYLKNMMARSTNQQIHMDEMRALAKDIGWKRLYFTNRIQLQRLLNRLREKGSATQHQGGTQKIALKVSQNGDAVAEDAPKSGRNGEVVSATTQRTEQEQIADIESVRWPSARPVGDASEMHLIATKNSSAQSSARNDSWQRNNTVDFPERAEAILANLPPEVRFLEALGPAVERPPPQLRTEDSLDEPEMERPPMDERAKQDRVKAWLQHVDHAS